MNFVEYVKNLDVKEEYEKMKELTSTFLKNYKEANPEKIRLIDIFIVFNFILLVVQMGYMLTNGLVPLWSGLLHWNYHTASMSKTSCEPKNEDQRVLNGKSFCRVLHCGTHSILCMRQFHGINRYLFKHIQFLQNIIFFRSNIDINKS